MKRSQSIRPTKPRHLFISLWVWPLALIFGMGIVIGVFLSLGYGGQDLGNRLFGIAVTVFTAFLATINLTNLVVVADQVGFHALLRHKLFWKDAQWADLVSFSPGFFPVVSVRIIGKDTDPKTGALHEYIIKGLAGYTATKRHDLIVTQFNDWIATANPNWVVNPWIHQSNRSDNR